MFWTSCACCWLERFLLLQPAWMHSPCVSASSINCQNVVNGAEPSRVLLQMEWVDVEAEEKANRLRWVAASEPVASSAVEYDPTGLLQERPRIGHRHRSSAGAATGTPGVSMGPEPEARGSELIGRRIGIWWPEDARFYYGSVEEFSSGGDLLLSLA